MLQKKYINFFFTDHIIDIDCMSLGISSEIGI